MVKRGLWWGKRVYSVGRKTRDRGQIDQALWWLTFRSKRGTAKGTRRKTR
jgi:hypothetical protein